MKISSKCPKNLLTLILTGLFVSICTGQLVTAKSYPYQDDIPTENDLLAHPEIYQALHWGGSNGDNLEIIREKTLNGSQPLPYDSLASSIRQNTASFIAKTEITDEGISLWQLAFRSPHIDKTSISIVTDPDFEPSDDKHDNYFDADLYVGLYYKGQHEYTTGFSWGSPNSTLNFKVCVRIQLSDDKVKDVQVRAWSDQGLRTIHEIPRRLALQVSLDEDEMEAINRLINTFVQNAIRTIVKTPTQKSEILKIIYAKFPKPEVNLD